MDINKLHPSKDNIPKLIKNYKIKSQWGPLTTRYYKAVKAAVIARPRSPYTPTEPPATLSEEIVESDPLYVCDQCKDCFRFESSFEDHINRRSWILGLWCYMCFVTFCTHRSTTTDPACLLCLKKDSYNRMYLKTRGFTKNNMLGAVKVFYNHCQFSKHLETHKCTAVDLANLMLVPLPATLRNNDWSPELEIACEALIEHAFLSRVHINDWFRRNNIENTWWKLLNDRNDNNPICRVIKGYRGRQVFKPLNESDNFANSAYVKPPLTESVSSPYYESPSLLRDTNGDSGVHRSTSENEDDQYKNGITFVDCGQAMPDFVPESTSYVPEARKKVSAKPSRQVRKVMTMKGLKQIKKPASGKNVGVSDSVQPLKKMRLTAANPGNTPGSDVPSNPHASSIPTKTSLASNSSKIMTIQDPKNIASIITQLSPSLGSNNKILILGKDIGNIILPGTDKVPTETTCKSASSNSNTSVNTPLQTCDAKTTKQQIEGQIIIRNGKKYLIKKVESATNNVNNSNLPLVPKMPPDNISTTRTDKTHGKAAENGVEAMPLSNNTACLPPLLPASSTASVDSAQIDKDPIASQSERNSVNPHEAAPGKPSPTESGMKFRVIDTITFMLKNNNIYMRLRMYNRSFLEYRIMNFCHKMHAYSRQMTESFERMDVVKLEERINHLASVKEELTSVLSFMPGSAVEAKLKTVDALLQTLERCRRRHWVGDVSEIGAPDENNDDPRLVNWESEATRRNVQCAECDKPIRPEMYVPGFSKPPRREFDYCLCYKQVCHECRTYEGNIDTPSRFIQHRNFHKRGPPHVCPDCQTAFSSAVLLEAHMWTACFHTLRRRFFCCRLCDIDGFRDVESITRHYVVMHSSTKTACDLCGQVFSTYRECVEHYPKAHSVRREPVRLVACKPSNVIVRWKDYPMYLEDFRGVRKMTFFKCPFCSFVTADNKHAEVLVSHHIRTLHFANLAETISNEAFFEIFKTQTVKRGGKTYVKINDNCAFRYADTLVIPKIVNTRTISSEIFERGKEVQQRGSSTANSKNLGYRRSGEGTYAKKTNTAKDNENRKAKESLPKILNVVSMANMKLSIPKERITLPKTYSESLHTGLVEAEDTRADQCEDVEEVIDVDVFKSVNAEETEATPDAISDELVALSSPEKLPTSTTSRIKVVDIRKICKPDVAPLIDAEMRDARAEDTSSSSLISESPPLVKMPRRVAKSSQASGSSDCSGNVGTSRDPAATVARTRIAIHGTRDGDVEYACHLCSERITTSRSVVRRHFDERHSDECRLAAVSPRASRMSPDFVNGGYKALVAGQKRKTDAGTSRPGLFASKRKRRWTPKKWQDREKPAGLCVTQETAEDGEGNFKCKRCDQRCADISDLRRHIATSHRIKDDYFVCLECGENFVVTPSLQMHLRAFHGIDDPTGYMNENPSYAPGVGGDSEKGKTDNQCYVCKEIFEDKAAVDKHLRVHGMAFLNRKRIEARNAQESPEKKVSRDKQAGVKETPKDSAKREKPLETILEKLNAVM